MGLHKFFVGPIEHNCAISFEEGILISGSKTFGLLGSGFALLNWI